MRRRCVAPVVLLTLLLCGAHLFAQTTKSSSISLFPKTNGREIEFIENRGQLVDQFQHQMSEVLYSTYGSGMRSYFTTKGMHFVFSKLIPQAGENSDNLGSTYHQPHDTLVLRRLDLTFEGANPNVRIESLSKSSTYFNYYLSHCKLYRVPSFHRLVYHDLYPKIDMIVFSENGALRYDFIIHPGGDPAKIVMRYGGADSVVAAKDSYSAYCPLGSIHDNALFCFQENCGNSVNGNTSVVASHFLIDSDRVRFSLGRYDVTHDLIIDPIRRMWGTYLGGSLEEQGQSPVVDRANNVSFMGYTLSTSGIATTGAYQTSHAGGYDLFLAQFDGNGNMRWCTYYGGTGDEYPGGVALDSTAHLIIYGQTASSSGIATSGVFDTVLAGLTDMAVAKFDSTGLLLWATYFGGNANEQINGFRSIACDHAGRLYITGTTSSTSGLATSTAFQPNLDGNGNDAFVASLSPTGSLRWATYYGGPQDDQGEAVATDQLGFVYVGGATGSSSNITVSSPYQTVYGGGGHDGFIGKFFAFNGSPAWVTYYGGSLDDYVGGMCTDSTGDLYVCGNTTSSNGISTVGSYQPAIGGPGNIQDGFIAKFNSKGKRQWATYFGGPDADFAEDVELDSDRLYICGRTASLTNIATGAVLQNSLAGQFDAFIARFTFGGVPIWATYYGGPYTDYGYGCALDSDENPVMAGSTTSPNGIASPGAYQSSEGGTSRDAYLVKFCDIDQPILTNSKVTICSNGQDTLRLNKRYDHMLWFDTSAQLTQLNDSVEYVLSEALVTPGKHAISVEVFKGLNCNAYTDTITFIVYQSPSLTASNDTSICAGESVTLNAAATNGKGPYTYLWLPAAGLSNNKIQNPKATPASTTTYYITATDANGCTAEDSVTVTINPLPTITLNARDTICPGSSTIIGDTAQTGIPPYQYQWSPAAGLSATNVAMPLASPSATTTYHVIVTDAAGCQVSGNETVVISSVIKPKTNPVGTVTVCEGDSVVIHAQKGFATYSWSTGATADSIVVTQSGSYAVAVTTNSGCSGVSDSVRVIVGQPPTPTITPSGPVSICPGGSVQLTANSGAYTYKWSTGETTQSITVNSAGSYSVAVSSGPGCTGTSSPVIVTIDSIAAPIISGPASICIAQAQVGYSCTVPAGATVNWSLTNGTIVNGQGTDTITVQWNDASPGTATVEVFETTSGGCQDSAIMTVTIQTNLTPIITANGPLSFCSGDSVTLDAGSGYLTYQWSKDGTAIPNANAEKLIVSQSGSYTVAVSNASGCSGTSTATTVTVFPTPQAPVITQTGDSLISTVASTYQWYLNGTLVPGAISQILSPLTNGNYTVTITDANGCTNTSAPITVGISASATVSVPPSLTADPGAQVSIPVTISNAVNLLQSGAKNYVGILRFNSSMLASEGSTAMGSMSGTDRLISFTGSNTIPSGVLQTLTFTATLGTDSCTDIAIDTFYWTDATVNVTRIDGEFCETGICNADGQLRLIDPSAIISLAQSKPNPASSIVEFDFQTPEEGLTSLIITDLLGRPVRTVLEKWLMPGPYSATTDVSTFVTGSYFYTLRTPSLVLTKQMLISH